LALFFLIQWALMNRAQPVVAGVLGLTLGIGQLHSTARQGVIAATPNDEFGSLKGHCEKFANATEADHSAPAAIVLPALLARWGV